MSGYPYANLFPRAYGELLSLVVPHAQSLLQQPDGFLPFAAAGRTGGGVELLRVEPGADDAEDVAWELLQQLGRRVDAGELVSAAQCGFLPEREMVWGDGAGITLLLEARGLPPVMCMLSCRHAGNNWSVELRPMLLPGNETLFATVAARG